LTAPWPLESLDGFIASIGKLQERNTLIEGLSLNYRSELFELDALVLQQEWSVAEKSVWPLNRIRQRALTKRLKAFTDEQGAPALGDDIERLVTIQTLKDAITAVPKFHTTADDIWNQLLTDLEAAAAAIEFQRWLACAAAGDVATLKGALDIIVAGRCGQAIAGDHLRILELKRIDSFLNEPASLGTATDDVWQGYATDLSAVASALALQGILRAVTGNQAWQFEPHALVESGACGPVARSDSKLLTELLRLEADIHQLRPYADKTAGLWRGLSSDVAELQEAIKFCNSLTAVLTKIATSTDLLIAVRTPIERLLGEGNLLLEAFGAIASAGQTYIGGWTGYQQAFSEFSKEVLRDSEREAELDELAPDEILPICRGIIQSAPRLKNWCAWNKACTSASTYGLGSLVDGIEKRAVSLRSVRKTFEVNYCRWWLNAVVDSDEVLLNFVSAEHEKRIRDFKELDERFTALTRSWVRAQLCAELPAQDSVSRNSEWGLLRYEMQKKSKHLPLRDLMGRSPSAITTLSPCLLMSPLSVAQYLSPEVTNFDIVIFDEASQIPVWDAIGAIARAKQVVMVGDPKQLPPTSFFDRAESDSDDTDAEADLESILDECIGANLPTINLSWHYRSRHESLIAFSNHRYYEGGLVTFPSPYTEDKAVSFHYVANGRYEKGGARTNQVEAKALVDDLVGKLKTECRENGLTVGVVTFNSQQQKLIEDLLDDARRKDPTLETYFADTELEPVFVKNLESVQGDERDIMYFSLTYGPSISGSVSMNFGPLNNDGGERRLNVAITRARQELRVFSSLRSEQLDLSRTKAEGVRDLKHFMEFAERGAQALGEAIFGSIGDFESPFEEAVARVLTQKGWRLQSQIGVSAFRIDLGVVDPDAPGSYLAGIECDGATYHRSATARDRDMIREQMLRGLGWDILRIWSTDWWVDADTVASRIHARLNELLEQKRAKRALQSNIIPIVARQEESAVEFSPAAVLSVDESPLPMMQYAKVEPAKASHSFDSYSEVDIEDAGFATNPNAFFEDGYASILSAMIDFVVNGESPLRDDVLARRIARAHGWLRTGSRIQERVNQLAGKRYHFAQEGELTFVWKSRDDITGIRFRAPLFGENRAVEDVSTPELAELAKQIFESGIHEKIDGMSAMANKLGLQRLRAASKERLANAWDLAVAG
jgi:very-short-patch-repair endonuclease